jgi:4'-phosphopantetheinyl transferase
VECVAGPTLFRAQAAGDVRSPAAREVHVFYVDIDAGSTATLAKLLSADEIGRADRFHFARDARRFVHARAALRRMLGAYRGCAPEDVEFAYGPQGKPAMRAPSGPPLAFNLSHSGGRALLAFTSGSAVGVDLERIVEVPDALDLAARFFAAGERRALETAPPSDRSRAFLSGWTRKEAFVKARGEGLGFPLDRFEVTLSPRPARLLALQDGDPAAWTIVGLEPEEGHLAAVAVEGGDYEVTMFGTLGAARAEAAL